MQRSVLVLALALCASVAGCKQPQFAAPQSPLATTDAAESDLTPLAELIELDLAATNRYIQSDAAGEVLVRIRVHASERTNVPRTPSNVALVIDTSASMKGEPIEQARAAALAMLEVLEPGDLLTVVAFHSRAEVLIPSTMISEKALPAMREAIEGMRATGTTALAEGLGAGVGAVGANAGGNFVSRIVLLSDGVPNDDSQVRNLANVAAQQSISITALGLGVGYNESLLADIATTSHGSFHYVQEPDQIATMFREEVLRMDRVLAVGSTITLNAGPGVEIAEVLGRPEVQGPARRVSVHLGDLFEDATDDLVVRLTLGEYRDATTVELLDATLQFQDPLNGQSGKLDVFLAVEAIQDDALREAGVDNAVELVAAKATVAAETLQIMDRARAGDVKGATAQLKVASKRARQLAAGNGDPELTQLAEQLSALRGNLSALPPPARKATPQPSAEPQSGAYGVEATMAVKQTHSDAFNALR